MRNRLFLLFLLLMSAFSSKAEFSVTTFANPGLIMKGETTTLFAYAEGVDEEVSYHWEPAEGVLESPDDAITKAKPKQTTTYTVTATAGELIATATLTVYVLTPPDGLTAVVEGNDVYLEWNEMELAESYVVICDGTMISTYVTDTRSVDENLSDGRYCYSVKSVRGGKDSPASNNVCVDVDMMSLKDNDDTFVEIYPNPARDKINVKADDMKTLSLTNMKGQVMIRREVGCDETTISVGNLERGMYILHIEMGQGTVKRNVNIVK